ncbi:hypothetical protein [Tardiphaga sp. 709]|uniref:hypothetical protein n=1 Tax=Tardiphaga sp. 709 TaxID=3076039 RepID=UPI0028E4144D|nr:hypothetical protein [Tardiphaga sp. 709]WNV09607.1 hypothetical protein RSO67_29865 [Tardiphaga sp. 709]
MNHLVFAEQIEVASFASEHGDGLLLHYLVSSFGAYLLRQYAVFGIEPGDLSISGPTNDRLLRLYHPTAGEYASARDDC